MKVKIVEIGKYDAWRDWSNLIGKVGEFYLYKGSELNGEWESGSFYPDNEPDSGEYFFRYVRLEPIEEEVTVTSPVVSSPIKRKFRITLEVQVEEMTEEEA